MSGLTRSLREGGKSYIFSEGRLEAVVSHIEGVVYAPPTSNYPAVVVFFGPTGEILATYAAETQEAGQEILVRILNEVQAKLDG